VLELAAQFAEPRIVDVGTGSGAIAVALAHKLPNAHIAATDVSEAALDLARENAVRNGVGVRIRFLRGDLLTPVAADQFDIVVSNPPYVPTADRDSLAVEVRDFEPGLALFAGEDGLDIYRRLIPAAFAVLISGGLVALEIGCGQSDAVGSLLSGVGFGEVEFRPDLQGIPRVALARRP
jgi:release factor glutamine methyltransferase